MADSRSVMVVDATLAPFTAGSPTFACYRDKAGNARTPPSIVHLGSGVWGFIPSDADEAVGTVAVIDFGATAYPRRATFAVHLADNSNQFWAVHVEADDGSEWVGSWPDFSLYDDASGNARTPPTLAPVLGDWVFAWTPTAADVVARVEGVLTAPAGSSVPWFGFSTEPAPAYPFAALADNPARAVATYIAAAGALNLETPPGGTQALAFAAGGNLTAGPMRASEGLVGDFHVSVLNTGGAVAGYFGNGGSLFEASVLVQVRSKIDAYSHGEAVARALLARMHRATMTGFVSCLARDAEPVYQGLDEEGHHRFVFGLDVVRVR